jgi:hypothetical protein
LKNTNRSISLVLFIISIFLPILGVTEQAEAWTEPHFSADGDTLYYGEYLILRNTQLRISRADTPSYSHPQICSEWGAEVRITYVNTDSTYNASSPAAWASFDTAVLKYNISIMDGRGRCQMVKTTDFGQNWSLPYEFIIPNASRAFIKDFGWQGDYFLATGTAQPLDEESRYNVFFRRSPGWSLDWEEPEYMLYRNAYFVGESRVRPLTDTLYLTHYLGLDFFNNRVDSIFISRSYDLGQDWTPPQSVVYAHGASSADIYFEISIGVMNITYEVQRPTDGNIEIHNAVSSDGGYTWTEQTMSDDDSIDSQIPCLSRGISGELLITWFDYKYGSGPGGWGGDILCRASYDGGLTWGPERRATFNHTAHGSAALIDGNHFVVVWEDTRHNGLIWPDLYFSESFDAGVTWTEEIRLTDAPGAARVPLFVSDYPRALLFWEDSRDDQGYSNEIYMRSFEASNVSIQDEIRGNDMNLDIQCYPNPFNDDINIIISGSLGEEIDLSVYDITGMLVKRLKTENMEGGDIKVVWDATDTSGKKVSSGIYFARAKTPRISSAIKLIYLK